MGEAKTRRGSLPPVKQQLSEKLPWVKPKVTDHAIRDVTQAAVGLVSDGLLLQS